MPLTGSRNLMSHVLSAPLSRGLRCGQALLLVLLVLLTGCTSQMDANLSTLDRLHSAGQYAQAAQYLDSPEIKDSYGDRSRLLYWLDRGSIALALDDPGQAVTLLEKAEDFMESQREPSTGETIGQWVINDTVTAYYGEPYEEIYVNVLKLLAYLELGQIDNGATVEARRAAGKADVLRDRYVRGTAAALQLQRADDRSRSFAKSAAVAGAPRSTDTNAAGAFLDSTLATYLTAVTFLKDGDSEIQRVAARRLQSGLDLQRNLQAGVNPADFDGLANLRPSDANVLIVGLSGRGPRKIANRVGPIPLYEWPLYFELPELSGGSAQVARVRVLATRLDAPAPLDVSTPRPRALVGSGPGLHELAKIEDMSAVATENHRRQLPLIYTRTLIRSQLKAAASFAATQAVKNSQSRNSNSRDLAQVGMILAGLAFVGLTEKADLRCWTFMPGRADVALLNLEPGRWSIQVEFSGAGGGVHRSSPREITVAPGSSSLTTVVEHFWR